MTALTARSLLCAAAVTVQIPFLSLGASMLDEGSILTLATELAHGEHLYVDGITFAAPAIYELLGALFALFGESLLVARLLQALIFVICMLLGFVMVERVAGRGPAWIAAAAILALKPLGFPMWTMVNYAPLAMLFLMAALLAYSQFLDAPRRATLVGCGALAAASFFAQQNLGAAAALTVTLGVALRRWIGEERSLGGLLGDGLALAGGAAATTTAFVAGFWLFGDLAEAWRLVILRPLEANLGWKIDLPAPWPWPQAELGGRIYAYLPAAYGELVLQGRLRPEAGLVVRSLETAVKLVYYLPFAALAVALFRILREPAAKDTRLRWIVLTTSAALAYATILRRADWAHLANVVPILVVAMAALLGRTPRFGTAVAALWLAFGVVTSGALLMAERSSVETAGGTLRATAHRASQLERLLAWSAERSREETIAFLPAQPLAYFVTGRRMPVSTDLLIRFQVKDPEDELLALQLGEVQTLVLDPTPVPSVIGELPEFAPRASAVITRDFAPTRVLSPLSIVMERQGQKKAPTVVDLLDQTPEGQREAWLVWRVAVPTEPQRVGQSSCLTFRHAGRKGERFETLPMFHPRTWAPDYHGIWFPKPTPALVSIELKPEGENWRKLYQKRIRAGLPPGTASIPVGARKVEIRACVMAFHAKGDVSVPVGFAEPRVVGARGASL